MPKFLGNKKDKTGSLTKARRTKSELLLLGSIGGLTGEALVGAILVSRFLANFFKPRNNASKDVNENVVTPEAKQTQPVLQPPAPKILPEQPKDDLEKDNEVEFFQNLNKKINDPKEANTSFFKDINKLLLDKDRDTSLKDIERILHIHTKLLQSIDLNTGKIDSEVKKSIPSELDKDLLLSKERKNEFVHQGNEHLIGPKSEEPQKESKTSGLTKLAEDALAATLTGLGLKAASGLIKKLFSTSFIAEMAESAGGAIIAALTAPETIVVLGGALLAYFIGPKAKELFDKQVEHKTEEGLSNNYTNTIRDRLNKGEKLEDIKKDLVEKGKKAEAEHPELPSGSTEREINSAIDQVSPSYLPTKESAPEIQKGSQPWTPPSGYKSPVSVNLSGEETPSEEPTPVNNTNKSTIDQLVENLPATPQTQIENQQTKQQNSSALDVSAFPVKTPKTSQGLDVSAFPVKKYEPKSTSDTSNIKYESGKIPPQIAELALETEKQTGVPAKLTVAQWAVESGYGLHTIYGTNPFGITKSSMAPQGDFKSTTEDLTYGQYQQLSSFPDIKNVEPWEKAKPSAKDPNKKTIHLERKFAKYASLKDAFIDHAKLLANPKGIYAERFEKYKKTGDLKQFIHDISNAPANPQPGHDRGAYGTDTRMEDTLNQISFSPKVTSALDSQKNNEQPDMIAQLPSVDLLKRNPDTGTSIRSNSLSNELQKSSSSKPIVVPMPVPSGSGSNSGQNISTVVVPAPIRNSDDTYKDANILSWRNT